MIRVMWVCNHAMEPYKATGMVMIVMGDKLVVVGVGGQIVLI